MVYLFSFFIAAVLALTITPRVIRFCSGWGFLDRPDHRKQHREPMPLAGGITLFPFAIIGLTAAFIGNEGLFFVLLGASLIFAVGTWDDRFGCHFMTKFLVQTIAALSVMQAGVLFDLNRFVFLSDLGFKPGHFLSFFVTIFWIVGITNAVNLIDGMDGLASGLCFNAFIGMGALAIVSDRTGLGMLCLIMSGALLGFLRYNIYPAGTFLGDSGSLLLGFILAVVSITHSAKTSTFLVLVVPILLLAIPLTDTVFAFIRRSARGENPFKADREHIHHRLLDLNFTAIQVLGMFYGLSASLGILGLLLAQTIQIQILALGLLLLIAALATVKVFHLFRVGDAVRDLNVRVRAIARKAVGSMRDRKERLRNNLVILTGVSSVNLVILFKRHMLLSHLVAAVLALFVLGALDLYLNNIQDSPRYEITRVALFCSLVLNQVTLVTVWGGAGKTVGWMTVLAAIAALLLLGYFLYRTGTFAVIIAYPMDILSLYIGVLGAALAKHFLGAASFLPFAAALANALILYTLARVYLSGYRVRSWTLAAGTVASMVLLLSMPWWE
ncbi:MAG: MraY family glycosyltransferase [bacterium]|nr:MraY family glycosyltransferase [bacterium]